MHCQRETALAAPLLFQVNQKDVPMAGAGHPHRVSGRPRLWWASWARAERAMLALWYGQVFARGAPQTLSMLAVLGKKRRPRMPAVQ